MTAGDRSPCLIAAARHTWHPADGPAPEPLDMWEHVVRALPGDAGISSRAVEQVDDLNLVHCQSWAYDRPVERLAERLGLHPANRSESILAGTSPQRLLNLAAERMLRGETRAALVVGGEALATRRLADRGGAIPPWSHPHPSPPTNENYNFWQSSFSATDGDQATGRQGNRVYDVFKRQSLACQVHYLDGMPSFHHIRCDIKQVDRIETILIAI